MLCILHKHKFITVLNIFHPDDLLTIYTRTYILYAYGFVWMYVLIINYNSYKLVADCRCMTMWFNIQITKWFDRLIEIWIIEGSYNRSSDNQSYRVFLKIYFWSKNCGICWRFFKYVTMCYHLSIFQIFSNINFGTLIW